jgi:hypothetical protein
MQIHLRRITIHNIAATIENMISTVTKQPTELSHGVCEPFPSNKKLKVPVIITNMKCGIELGHHFFIPVASEAHDFSQVHLLTVVIHNIYNFLER